MSASTMAKTSSTSVYTTPAFWERLWRQSGINFVVFLIIAYVVEALLQREVKRINSRSTPKAAW